MIRSEMKTVKLGDVCEFKSKAPTKSLPYVGMEDIESNSGRFLGSLESRAVKSTTSYFDETCVLYGKLRPYLNKVFVPDFEGHCSTEFITLRPDLTQLDRKYLWRWLTSPEILTILSANTTGTRMPRANLKVMKELEIELPSLEEQRRVVERLDAAFEQISAAEVLMRRNLDNVAALFGSLLNKAADANDDVIDKTLGDIAEVEYGLTEKAKSDGKVRFVRITDIDSNGMLNRTGKMYIDDSSKVKQYLLKKGDLVVARTGATFGKVLYFDDDEPSAFASYLIRINFKEDIDPKLFWYYAKTPQYWNQANSLAGGAAQPQFNGGALKKILFRYPKDRATQQEIVRKLDEYYNSSQKLTALYGKKLTKLTALRESLLQKTFSTGV